MTWLALSYFLLAGAMTDASLTQQNAKMVSVYVPPSPYMVITVGGELQAFDLAFIGASFRTDTDMRELAFAPFAVGYEVHGGLRYAGFELGIRHACDHPVLTRYSKAFTGQFYRGYTVGYLMFSGTIGGK